MLEIFVRFTQPVFHHLNHQLYRLLLRGGRRVVHIAGFVALRTDGFEELFGPGYFKGWGNFARGGVRPNR